MHDGRAGVAVRVEVQMSGYGSARVVNVKFAVEFLSADSFECDGDPDISGFFVTVNSSYLYICEAGFSGGFYSERSPYSAAWQRRAEVPAELVLGFADVSAIRIGKKFFAEWRVSLHQVFGVWYGGVEFNEQTIGGGPDAPGDVETMRDEHIIRSAEEFFIEPYAGDGVEAVAGKFDFVGLEQLLRRIESFSKDPGLVTYPCVIFGICIDVTTVDFSGFDEVDKYRIWNGAVEPVAVVEVAHSPGGCGVFPELPLACQIENLFCHSPVPWVTSLGTLIILTKSGLTRHKPVRAGPAEPSMRMSMHRRYGI